LLYQKPRTLYIKETNISELSIVILKSQAGKFGLIVDKLHKNTEIAVKSSPESLSKIEIISGVSILGDGRVILVLNPEKLV
jgi:two-component system chemotaxis sensor kinase CheA